MLTNYLPYSNHNKSSIGNRSLIALSFHRHYASFELGLEIAGINNHRLDQ